MHPLELAFCATKPSGVNRGRLRENWLHGTNLGTLASSVFCEQQTPGINQAWLRERALVVRTSTIGRERSLKSVLRRGA